jgi:hypothetical protein
MHGRAQKCLKMLVLECDWKKQFEGPRQRYEDNIKMDLKIKSVGKF